MIHSLRILGIPQSILWAFAHFAVEVSVGASLCVDSSGNDCGNNNNNNKTHKFGIRYTSTLCSVNSSNFRIILPLAGQVFHHQSNLICDILQ
jgi:hypothetical protein